MTASDDGIRDLVLTGQHPQHSVLRLRLREHPGVGCHHQRLSDNAIAGTSTARTTLQGNYNALLTQIDQLAGDFSYNGVNLLNGDNLQVEFNENGTSSLTIAGVKFDPRFSCLRFPLLAEFRDNSTITASVTNSDQCRYHNGASPDRDVRHQLVNISTRQTFEKNMINTLQTGARNLVLADQNQESANLLTEQTRQQLEISALSIANQANQSVLKLFP